MITNHSVPGPLIVRRALQDSVIHYVSIVHGSCLQYLSRRSEKYMGLTREGLEAAEMLALSSHSVGTVAEDFPDLTDRIKALPGGVDTGLFSPDAFDLGVVEKLNGGPGRSPDQRSSLQQALRSSGNATELAGALREISASYDARAHDSDAGERINASSTGRGRSWSTSGSSSTPRASTACFRPSPGYAEQTGRACW